MKDLRELRTVVVPRLNVEHANRRLDVLRRQTDRLLEQGEFVLNDLRGYVHGEYDRITREYGDFHREAGSLIRPLQDKAQEERRGTR